MYNGINIVEKTDGVCYNTNKYEKEGREMSKKVCELCGYADDSYTIEESGTVMKVCKFCHDGYLERMGMSPDDDKPVEDPVTLLDLKSAAEISEAVGEIMNNNGEEESRMKVEPLTEEELNRVLTGGHSRRRKSYSESKAEKSAEAEDKESAEVNQKPAPEKAEETKSESETVKSEPQQKKPKKDIMDEVNPRIDDERIKVTSPEVPLERDARPKTNLDVEVSEYKNAVRFIDAFKYVFHPVVYAIFLGVVIATVATVLFIVKTWQSAVYVLGCGIVAIGLSYFLMWYLATRYDKDKRAYLLRIRQQEILFDSMTSDCYRELKTKFTVLKSLGWLLSKLSVLLPLVTVLGGVVASVIVCFVYQVWLMPIIFFGSIVAGIVVYWLVKFFADMIAYKLDAERNQQLQQQTLLDILKMLKK